MAIMLTVDASSKVAISVSRTDRSPKVKYASVISSSMKSYFFCVGINLNLPPGLLTLGQLIVHGWMKTNIYSCATPQSRGSQVAGWPNDCLEKRFFIGGGRGKFYNFLARSHINQLSRRQQPPGLFSRVGCISGIFLIQYFNLLLRERRPRIVAGNSPLSQIGPIQFHHNSSMYSINQRADTCRRTIFRSKNQALRYTQHSICSLASRGPLSKMPISGPTTSNV